MRQGGVLTLPVYRGREQHGKGWEVGDKGMGNWRAGYGRQEVLTPCPFHLEFITFCYQVVVGGGGGGRSKVEGPPVPVCGTDTDFT